MKIELLYDVVIPFLGIYPKELKAETQTDTYTTMFIAALFPRAKGRNKSNVQRWINT